MKNRIKQKAFTLLELLVAIAIVAILAGVAIPNYFKYTKKAKFSSVLLAADAAKIKAVKRCAMKGSDLKSCNEDLNVSGPDITSIKVENGAIKVVTKDTFEATDLILTPTINGNRITWVMSGSACDAGYVDCENDAGGGTGDAGGGTGDADGGTGTDTGTGAGATSITTQAAFDTAFNTLASSYANYDEGSKVLEIQEKFNNVKDALDNKNAADAIMAVTASDSLSVINSGISFMKFPFSFKENYEKDGKFKDLVDNIETIYTNAATAMQGMTDDNKIKTKVGGTYRQILNALDTSLAANEADFEGIMSGDNMVNLYDALNTFRNGVFNAAVTSSPAIAQDAYNQAVDEWDTFRGGALTSTNSNIASLQAYIDANPSDEDSSDELTNFKSYYDGENGPKKTLGISGEDITSDTVFSNMPYNPQ